LFVSYLQLSDVELSFLWKFTFVFGGAVGGQYVFLGTDTHPFLSPSRAVANSKINLPSKITLKKKINEKLLLGTGNSKKIQQN